MDDKEDINQEKGGDKKLVNRRETVYYGHYLDESFTNSDSDAQQKIITENKESDEKYD